MKPEKLGPTLHALLHDYNRAGKLGIEHRKPTVGVVSAIANPKPARAVVFIHCDPRAGFDHLARYGIRVNQSTGRVRTAILPVDRLGVLSDEPTVERIVASRYLRPKMDVATGKVNVPAFRTTSGLDGRGVVIGIVDTGIDPNHPAFAQRIDRIWDQVLSGPGVPEGGYGLEVTGSLLSSSRDTHGHGTHVAGIAAGSDARFGGIASGARLVVVKTDFQTAHIADGVRYVFRIARDLGLPAVVNLSLGGHSDAHDGTDSLSQVIDEAGGAGRIVCCAAGNEGDDAIHAQKTIPAKQSRDLRFHVPAGKVGWAALNGWYPGASRFEVSVRSPGGFATPYQAVISGGSPSRSYSLPDAQVTITTPGPDPFNNDHSFLVELSGGSGAGPVAGGSWRLRVRNANGSSARLDVWTLDDQESSEVLFTGTSIADSMKVGSPGCARSSLTVASYTTKVEWTSVDGNGYHVGFTVDDISDFSSEGPLRSGAAKPDLTAPGAVIVSALSRDSQAEIPWMIDPDPAFAATPRYRGMMGTSMATPFVTGLVALCLQRAPAADPDTVRDLLRAACAVPGRPAGSFDPKWGYGLVDAARL